MKLHLLARGLCLELKSRYYPIFPAWTTYVQLSGCEPRMTSKGRIYFEKLPKLGPVPKQRYNPADGWLDT